MLIRAGKQTHHQGNGAQILTGREGVGSLSDFIRSLIYLSILGETRTSMRIRKQTCPRPSIVRAVNDEPENLAREWLDAVHVGNDAPRILLARGPATASAALAASPTRLIFLSGLRKSLSSSCLL